MRPIRSSWASAPSSPSDSSPRNRSRSPRPPGSSWSRVEASWARSQRRRSSRSSASIIESSSARCSAESDRSSDCIAAIRSASESMMSSRVRAPGKNAPCRARKRSTSSWDGSSSSSRRVSSWSRSRTISRLAASCSEVAPAIAWDMPLEDGVRDLPPELLEQLVETLSCLWFEEVVVLEGPDPIADIVRQGIESLLAPGGQSAASLPSSGVSPGPPASRRSMPRRSDATTASSSARTSPRTSSRWYRWRASRRACARRFRRASSPLSGSLIPSARRGRPRRIRRMSASRTSLSSIRSSAMAPRTSSAVRSGSRWDPSQRA